MVGDSASSEVGMVGDSASSEVGMVGDRASSEKYNVYNLHISTKICEHMPIHINAHIIHRKQMFPQPLQCKRKNKRKARWGFQDRA